MVVFSVLEGELSYTGRGFFGDELNTLYYTVDDFVLDARVFALCVLANCHNIDVIVEGLVALQAAARSDICVQIELLSQGQVEGAVTLSNGCHERAFQSDLVFVDGINGSLRDTEASVWISDRCDIDGLPLERNFGSGEDFLHSS